MHVLKLDDHAQLHDLAEAVLAAIETLDGLADYATYTRFSRLLDIINAAKDAPEVPQDSAWQPPANQGFDIPAPTSPRMKAQLAEKAWRMYFARPTTEASLKAAQLTADYLHEVANG